MVLSLGTKYEFFTPKMLLYSIVIKVIHYCLPRNTTHNDDRLEDLLRYDRDYKILVGVGGLIWLSVILDPHTTSKYVLLNLNLVSALELVTTYVTIILPPLANTRTHLSYKVWVN